MSSKFSKLDLSSIAKITEYYRDTTTNSSSTTPLTLGSYAVTRPTPVSSSAPTPSTPAPTPAVVSSATSSPLSSPPYSPPPAVAPTPAPPQPSSSTSSAPPLSITIKYGGDEPSSPPSISRPIVVGPPLPLQQQQQPPPPPSSDEERVQSVWEPMDWCYSDWYLEEDWMEIDGFYRGDGITTQIDYFKNVVALDREYYSHGRCCGEPLFCKH